MDNKFKQLQAAISVKIDNKIKHLQNYFDQEMANFINQTKAVSDRLEILEKTEKERWIFEPDTTIVSTGLAKQQEEDVDLSIKPDIIIIEEIQLDGDNAIYIDGYEPLMHNRRDRH